MRLRERVLKLEGGRRGNVDFAPLLRACNRVAELQGKEPPFDLKPTERVWGHASDFHRMVEVAWEAHEERQGSEAH